jgi:hypothetical protein
MTTISDLRLDETGESRKLHNNELYNFIHEGRSETNASNVFFLYTTAGMQIKLVCHALKVFKYFHLFFHIFSTAEQKPASPLS